MCPSVEAASEAGRFDGPACHAFLEQLYATSTRTGRHVVLTKDNASYHHSALHKPWRERPADRFELDYLPPYSPNSTPSNAS